MYLLFAVSSLDGNYGWVFQNDQANTLVKTSSITCCIVANIRLLIDPSGITEPTVKKNRSDLRRQTGIQAGQKQKWPVENLGNEKKISNFEISFLRQQAVPEHHPPGLQ